MSGTTSLKVQQRSLRSSWIIGTLLTSVTHRSSTIGKHTGPSSSLTLQLLPPPPARVVDGQTHCHGGPMSWYNLPSPSLPTSGCLQPHLPLLPLLCSNSKVYLCNSYNYIAPTLGLTADQYRTCSDLVPTPRAAIYIPFLHLSYLPDPFSLTIMGNYSFLV